MSTEVPYPAYTFPEYDTPMPNPLGVIKKIPKKLVSTVIRLTKLDRILLEMFVTAISIPDERIEAFFEVKLRELAARAEKPLKEIAENLGQKVLRPIFQAIPFVNLVYLATDIQKAQEAVADAQLPFANVIKEIIKEARELTSDVVGPARGLSSFLLGMTKYLEKLEQARKKGEDVPSSSEILNEIGLSINGEPADEDPKKAAARLAAAVATKKVATESKGKKIDMEEAERLYDEIYKQIFSDKETMGGMFGPHEKGIFEMLMEYAAENDDTQKGRSRKNRLRLRHKNKTKKNN
jgi:hypothetical protein